MLLIQHPSGTGELIIDLTELMRTCVSIFISITVVTYMGKHIVRNVHNLCLVKTSSTRYMYTPFIAPMSKRGICVTWYMCPHGIE